jgi:hypothetical protein
MTEKLAPVPSGDQKRTTKRRFFHPWGTQKQPFPTNYPIGRDIPLEKNSFLESPAKKSQLNEIFEVNSKLVVTDSPWISKIKFFSGYEALVLTGKNNNFVLAIRSGQLPNQHLSFVDYLRANEEAREIKGVTIKNTRDEEVVKSFKYDPDIIIIEGNEIKHSTVLLENEGSGFLESVKKLKVDKKETKLLKKRQPDLFVPIIFNLN